LFEKPPKPLRNSKAFLGALDHHLRGRDFVISPGQRGFDIEITAFSMSIR
jgi:hypothetical protein